MNVPGRGRTKKFICDFKGFAKDEEVTEITRAVVEVTHSFPLGVGGMTLRTERWVIRSRLGRSCGSGPGRK